MFDVTLRILDKDRQGAVLSFKNLMKKDLFDRFTATLFLREGCSMMCITYFPGFVSPHFRFLFLKFACCRGVVFLRVQAFKAANNTFWFVKNHVRVTGTRVIGILFVLKCAMIRFQVIPRGKVN